MVDLLQNRDNAISGGFAIAAPIIIIFLWANFGWRWWFLLVGIVILAFALMVGVTLPLTATASLPEPVQPREIPARPKPLTPDRAVSATQRLLDYAFPDDADARAVVERDLARAAGERGRRDYADLLRDRFRPPA